MSTELETGLEAYPELQSEEEEAPRGADDRPVLSQPRDWPISGLREKYERKLLDLQPHYQREYVWDQRPELRSRLVESILLEIPIPPIYLGQLAGGRMEIIDGQQRLTTLIDFISKGGFPLERLERMPSLNGKTFGNLPPEHQEKLLDSSLRCVIIDSGSNQNLRYEIFERLNRGSMPLNEQELRNCVYRGGFCDLLAELEKDKAWRKVKGGDKPEPRFVEREMILRFFAFAARIDHYAGNLKRFLNDYMGKYAPQEEGGLNAMEIMFQQTMKNVYTVFGANAGHLYSTGTEDRPTVEGRWEPKFSISALDIQASALIGLDPKVVQTRAEEIRELYIFYLLTRPQVRLAISRQPAATAATKLRWFGFKAEVQNLLTGSISSPRFFSLTFRQRLFEKSPVCAICGNQIHAFEDSTVDHILPYGEGGQTVPSNAQLAHRGCNARKYNKLAEVGDDPLKEARILIQLGQVSAAGARAGVALEQHLKLLCQKHDPPLVYGRGDGLSRVNELLKSAGVYDVAQWRQVQWMTDVRNACDHPSATPPTKADVEALIKEVQRTIAGVPV